MRKIALKSRERSGCVVRGFGRRDALGGRRDALGGSRVSLGSFWLVLSRVSPRRARWAGVAYSLTGLSGRAFPTLRRDARTNGERWCSAPPLWPSLGVAQCVAAASVAYSLTGLSGRRSLLSDRIERSGVAYSLTGCCG